jgi:hypothetical protein
MSPKLAIIVVVVVLVLFIASLVLGGRADSSAGTPSPQSFTPSGAMQSLGNLLVPLAPKLQLSPSTFVLQPGQSKAIVVPSSSVPLRRATFALTTGLSATIVYTAPPASAGSAPSALLHQSLTLPRTGSTSGNPRSGSVIALKEGGTLQLTCGLAFACTLQLE